MNHDKSEEEAIATIDQLYTQLSEAKKTYIGNALINLARLDECPEKDQYRDTMCHLMLQEYSCDIIGLL
jgi:hypothetical protein